MATLNWKTPNGTTGSLNLANIVLTTGAQTIGGAKTFSDNVTINADLKPMYGITMTGRLKGTSDETDNFIITTLSNTGMLYLTSNGVTDRTEKSGHIKLFGSAYGGSYNGAFEISAYDKKLRGNTDGTLTWCGVSINPSNYLPLAGGTMTGNLLADKGEFWIGNTIADNAGAILLRSANASYKNGATLALYGIGTGTDNAGRFTLQAADGTNTPTLVGRPNGVLTWNNKNVAWDVKTGTNNGTISVNGSNVAVKGLGSAAYTASSNYVDTSSDQTISGIKTFAGNKIILKRTSTDVNRAVVGKCVDLVVGTPPANENSIGLTLADKNDTTLGSVRIGYRSDGSVFSLLAAHSPINTSTINYLGVNVNSDGTVYTVAPTPATSDSSNKIATTDYVKANVPKSIGGTQRPVYTNANGVITACTATGSAGGLEGVNAKGSNYIQFTSGLQICWGGLSTTSSGTTVTYPKAYTTKPELSVTASGYTINSGFSDATATNFKASTNSSSGAWVDWLAVGKWK